VIASLTNNIRASGGYIFMNLGLPVAWTLAERDNFLNGVGSQKTASSAFTWSKLPSITFELPAVPGGQNFRLTLGPKQYIQQADDGYWMVVIRIGKDNIVVLGLPIFSAFYIMVDRDLETIGFSLGCG
jgi:hypothetical protein